MHRSGVKQSPAKRLTTSQASVAFLDKNFTKHTFQAHLTVIPFLTCMDVTKNLELHPFVAPVNHNFLNEAKTLNIVHTMMGNFCHGDEQKDSQMEQMGTDACVIVGFNDKVRTLLYLFSLHIFLFLTIYISIRTLPTYLQKNWFL